MTLQQVKKKVLIINWKWKAFQEKGHVNGKTFSAEQFKHYIAHIEEGEGLFYEEYKVEPSTLCPNAVVVATAIYKETEETEQLLYALIEKYTQASNQVMLFLHRSNFYVEKDVDQLLRHFKKKIAKCFLFAFGRDYIYYDTRQSGLLNDTGNFFRGRDSVTDEKVETFDIARKEVKQPYFDRVWQYYETEFESKILHLKEELFDCWAPFMLPDSREEILGQDLVQAIRKVDEQALFFRLKSFMGQYHAVDDLEDANERMNLKSELAKIKRLEKDRQESFLFDDCIVNLEHDNQNGKYLVKEVYDQTKAQLNEVLSSGEAKAFSKKAIHAISASMEELIKVVPGEID